MAVPQPHLHLFNLSIGVLRKLCNDRELAVPAHATKLDLMQALRQVPAAQLEEQARNYLYAGSTSISWIQLGSGEPIERDALRAAVVEVCGADPFDGEIRPQQVTNVPKLVEVRTLDEKIAFTFVVRKPTRSVVVNFEIQSIFEDHFFLMILRPDIGVAEVRSSHQRAGRLARTWLAELAEHLNRDLSFIAITRDDLRALKMELGAKMRLYRGKDASGTGIDTHEYIKSPDADDLETVPDFADRTEGTQPVHIDLTFAAEGIDDISLKVSAFKSSVWFRTAVPEPVIEYVFNALRRVQGF